jgi:hypothetical protein
MHFFGINLVGPNFVRVTLFFLNKFLLGYVHDIGGVSVIILIRLILYIGYIALIRHPLV